MPDTRDDRLAVKRALSGPVDEFEPLVRATAPRVIRLAYHFLGDWDEARDLAQETFARAYLNLHRYDPERPFTAWVFTIAARLATDRLRHRRAQSKAVREIQAASRGEADGPDLLDNLSLKEALGRLTPRQRQAVVLCDLHGFSASEASSMIRCSASTVRVLRFLARRRLRELLADGVIARAATEEPLVPEVGE